MKTQAAGKLSLDELKNLPGLITAPPSWESFPFQKLEGGISPGSLTELSGSTGGGKIELLMQFMVENPRLQIAWVEENITLFPQTFAEYGVRLERLLFIETRARGQWGADWAIQQILKTKLFPLIIWSEPAREEAALRRMQLAAQKSATAVILLCESPIEGHRWPIALRLRAYRDPASGEPCLEILKAKRKS